MKRKYEKKGQPDKAGLRNLLAKDGRDYLLPLVNVFALAGGALDQIIDVIGRAAIEAVLDISAADVAGEKQPGKERKGAGAAYHGRQRGRVYLADRAVRVERPRLRSPGEGELAIPAYEALRRPSGLGERMLELLLAGLSTRSYGKAIGEMAETAGVSKSSVSRQAAEAAGERLKELAERQLDDRDYLIVYVDGIQFGGHHVLAALGVDDKGNKRILGLREGGGRERERRRRAGAAREPRRARPGPREGEAVRPRRVQGAAQGGRPGLRDRVPRAALPEPQDAQRDRPSAQGTPRPGQRRAACRLEAGREGRQGEDRAVRVLGGEAASGRSGKPARRARRDVHRQGDRTDPGAPAVPGHDQSDRQRPLGDAPPHRPGDPVERRVHGGALGGRLRFWTPRRATVRSWATRTSGYSRRTWTSSALPRLTKRRLPRSMNRPRATATSNYGWDSLLRRPYTRSGEGIARPPSRPESPAFLAGPQGQRYAPISKTAKTPRMSATHDIM